MGWWSVGGLSVCAIGTADVNGRLDMSDDVYDEQQLLCGVLERVWALGSGDQRRACVQGSSTMGSTSDKVQL